MPTHRRPAPAARGAALGAVPAAVLTAVLAACVPGATPGDARTGMPVGGPSVLVTTGVRYADAPPGWADPTLDLYLPSAAGEPPLAVIVPDAGGDLEAPDYAGLARALAAGGVVAAVARWGPQSPELTAVAGREVEDLVAQTVQTTAQVSCALRVAAARAGPGTGTPDRRLVVVGHGAGANAAAMATLTTTPSFATCFAAGAAPPVAAAVLWDGDWLGAVADDVLGAGVSSFLVAYSPWPVVDALGTSTSTFVEVGVNANRLLGRAVETGPTGSYVTTRDPAGTITADLERVGAFDDGSVDPVDVTRAFSVALRDAEVQSRERELHGEGDPDTLGPRVRALIVQSVVQLTRVP